MAILVPWMLSLVYFLVLVSLLELQVTDTTHHIVRHVIYISFDVVALLGFVILTTSSVFVYKVAKSQIRRLVYIVE